MAASLPVRRLANPFRLLPPEVAVLAAVAFAVSVGFGVVAPVIPVFAHAFGVGKTAAGAVISAFALMRFVSALGGGQLVDRLDERLVLSTGIAVVALSTGLAGLSQSYVQLLVLRAAGGVGSAMFTVSAISLLFRVTARENRGRATSLYQGGFLVGGLLGPLAGGLLAEVSLRAPFFVYAATLVVAGAIGMVFLAQSRLGRGGGTGTGGVATSAEPAAGEPASGQPASGQPASGEPTAGQPAAGQPASGQPVVAAVQTGLRTALRSRAYRTALVANFGTGWSLFGVRTSLIPLFVTEALHARAAWIGVGFLCSSLAQAVLLVPAGRVVDRRGRRPVMVAGGLVAGAAMLLVALTTTLPTYVAGMLLFGVGAACLGTAPAAVVGDVIRGRGGRVVAVFQMSSDLGAILGPVVAGALADALGFGWALGMTAGVLLASAAMSTRMSETRGYSGEPVEPGSLGSPESTDPSPSR